MPDTSTTVYALEVASPVADEAELAAVAFLARYSGRTLDAYRHDLRSFFQWTADHGVETLAATRAHIELSDQSGATQKCRGGARRLRSCRCCLCRRCAPDSIHVSEGRVGQAMSARSP